MDAFDSLTGYQPQKLEDTFEVIKDKSLKCSVDYARIEAYDGDNVDLQGTEFYSIALTILDHPVYTGRKLWKRWNLSNEAQLKKLADQLFTLGLTFGNKEGLEEVSVSLVDMLLKVRAWGWKPAQDVNGNPIPENQQEERQQFIIKSEWQEATDKIETPKF